MANTNGYKSKSKRSRGKWNRTQKKDMNDERVDKPTNDPSWYTKYPQLVSDTSSLFFSNPLGSKIPKAVPASGNLTHGNLDYLPGIITIDTIAVPGYSNAPNSPVNAVARGIYSYIRHQNSGSKNYEAPDLMMYLLAVDTCYSFWASCVRAYGIARLYNVRSRYLAIQFLESMGFDPDDILANLAQFRTAINTFAVRISNYMVPASMDFFRRHTDMFTRVYLDAPSPKAQSYLFKLAKYYKYNNTTQDGGKLILTDFPAAKMTLDDVNTVMASLIDPIIGDEDMNVMSGDILKAYTLSGIFKVPMVDWEYVTPVVFDETVLSQIENSVCCPDLESTTLGVSQDPTTSSLYFAPQCAHPNDDYLYPVRILNLHKDDPSAIDVMEATRLMFSFTREITGTSITGFGAELVLGYTMWLYVNGVLTSRTFNNSALPGNKTVWEARNNLSVFSDACTFDHHPRLWVWAREGTTGAVTMVMDLFDYENYTVLNDSTLEQISNTAMLSLFDVEHLGLVQ